MVYFALFMFSPSSSLFISCVHPSVLLPSFVIFSESSFFFFHFLLSPFFLSHTSYTLPPSLFPSFPFCFLSLHLPSFLSFPSVTPSFLTSSGCFPQGSGQYSSRGSSLHQCRREASLLWELSAGLHQQLPGHTAGCPGNTIHLFSVSKLWKIIQS